MTRIYTALMTVVCSILLICEASSRADNQTVEAHQELPATATRTTTGSTKHSTTHPAKRSTTGPTSQPSINLRQLSADLRSTDKTKVAAALKIVHDAAVKHGHGWVGASALNILIEAKRYADADQFAVDGILSKPDDTP